MKKTVMEEIKTYKEYDAKLEKDFAALLADRNRLAEENRKCCDENERLLNEMRYIAEATAEMAARKPWHSIAHIHDIASAAIKGGVK